MKPFKNPIYVTRPLLADPNEIYLSIREIWESQWLTNFGTKHKQLEKELLDVLKVQNITLMNNGTIALMIAINSMECRGEIITTPFTFPATTHVIAWYGITPVFCDIDDKTLTIDPNIIEGLVTSKTSAILGVHVYGMPCNVHAIQKIANKHNLRVIYDAAHAFGTEINGRGIGTFGDVSMFSFHATKLFNTLEGGALAIGTSKLKKKIGLLKNFGIKNEEEVLFPGINGKMNEVQAAIGIINLRYLRTEFEKRSKIVEIYRKNLEHIPGIRLLNIPSNVKNSYQYFVIRITNEFGITRDEVYTSLKKYNVFSRKYFFPLTSEYDCYRNLPSADPHHLPIATKVAREVLCLPLYGKLALDDAEKICKLIRSMRI